MLLIGFSSMSQLLVYHLCARSVVTVGAFSFANLIVFVVASLPGGDRSQRLANLTVLVVASLPGEDRSQRLAMFDAPCEEPVATGSTIWNFVYVDRHAFDWV